MTQSLDNLLLTSETPLKLGTSDLFVRLVWVTLLLTLGLVFSMLFFWPLKMVLSLVVAWICKKPLQLKTPCPDLVELRVSSKRWVCVDRTSQERSFDKVNILIHNPWFQLILLKNATQKRHLVLFNDQLTMDMIRLLHVQAGLSG